MSSEAEEKGFSEYPIYKEFIADLKKSMSMPLF
jgi:hypothetical protein